MPALWMEGTDRVDAGGDRRHGPRDAEAPGDGLLTVSVGLPGVPVGHGARRSALGRTGGAQRGALRRPWPPRVAWSAREREVWLETPGHRVRFGHPIDLADKGRVAQVMLADGLPDGSTLDVVAPRRPAVILPLEPRKLKSKLRTWSDP